MTGLGVAVASLLLADAAAQDGDFWGDADPGPKGAKGAMGVLAAYLPPEGERDGWRYEHGPGGFTVANTTHPNSIDYVYVGGATGAERTVTAQVSLGRTDGGFAGLLVGWGEASDDYHLFAALGGGRFAIYVRNRNGFRPVSETTLEGAGSGPIVLEATERGDEVSF